MAGWAGSRLKMVRGIRGDVASRQGALAARSCPLQGEQSERANGRITISEKPSGAAAARGRVGEGWPGRGGGRTAGGEAGAAGNSDRKN